MKFLFLVSILLSTTILFSATRFTTEQYIAQWKNSAVDQMLRHKIPASITLAQGILESGNGNSKLAKEANNHFGIKCHAKWTGNTFIQDDDEKDECFRSYYSAEESYNDHSLFLTGRSRYSKLFTLKLTDYKGWAKGLKSAGYATNPKYAYLLIDLIHKFNLDEYDKMTNKDLHKEKLSLKKKVPTAKVEQVVKKSVPVKSSNNKKVKKEDHKEDVSIIRINAKGHREHLNKNKVKYITVKPGDTFLRIANEYQMTIGQLYKYNEFKNKDVLEEGDVIYITPKKSRARKGNEKYVCQRDISLREIAHEEGIKLDSLVKLNVLVRADEILTKGTKVILR